MGRIPILSDFLAMTANVNAAAKRSVHRHSDDRISEKEIQCQRTFTKVFEDMWLSHCMLCDTKSLSFLFKF